MVELAADRGLDFMSLGKKSLGLAVYGDASFASSPDLSLHPGLMIVLANCHGNARILHYTSVKSKRIKHSCGCAICSSEWILILLAP